MNNEEIKEIIANKFYELAPNTAIYFDSVARNMVTVSVRFYFKGEIKGYSNVLHTEFLTSEGYLNYFISGLMREYENIIINTMVGDKL